MYVYYVPKKSPARKLDVKYLLRYRLVFFFQAEDGIRDGRVTGVQTCALPIFQGKRMQAADAVQDPPAIVARLELRDDLLGHDAAGLVVLAPRPAGAQLDARLPVDRKSTRLNSSHPSISYAVFCLKKKNTETLK